MRCAKFGVAVCKASVLNGRGAMCHGYMYMVLYMKLTWCNGFAEIYAQLEGSGGSICHRYMCIVLYIYRFAMRCAKFGVAVCKASVLNGRGAMCHGYMCIVLYMKLMWCNGFAEIYA